MAWPEALVFAQAPFAEFSIGLNSTGRYNPRIYFLPLLLPFWKRKKKKTHIICEMAMMQICENQSENHIIYGRLLHKLTDWVPGEGVWEEERV